MSPARSVIEGREAAGPAGATRFVRSAALAAATGDEKAFEALVAQAKSNLK